MRLKLFIKYNGKNYHGWQIQNDRISVCEEIQLVLTKLYGNHKIQLHGSSRTDAGVHALRHTAHFEAFDKRFTPNTLLKALNANLPEDIRINGCQIVSENFHSRFDSKGKIYRYYISSHNNPFNNILSYNTRVLPDINILRTICPVFLGTHNFSAFAITKSIMNKNPNCTIFESRWDLSPQGDIIYTISGNRFLHHMVRMIVGAQLDLESNKLFNEDIIRFLETGQRCPPSFDSSSSNNRSQIKVAPASGLVLINAFY